VSKFLDQTLAILSLQAEALREMTSALPVTE
jgi:hypothetical protein